MKGVLLFAYGFLLGLSICQHQGESRETLWNSVQQSQSNPDDVELDKSIPNLHQQQQQQDSEISEYYDDDEYYDDETPTEELTEKSERELKVSRLDEKGTTRVNSTVYEEDSYYYDDEYEEEATTATVVNKIELIQHSEKLESTQELNKLIPKRNEEMDVGIEEEDKQSHDEDQEEVKKLFNQTSTDNKDIQVEAEEVRSPENVADLPGEGPILIGEAIVSVVTTKSVVNGTYSLPEITTSLPSTITFNADRVEANSSSTITTSTTTSVPTIFIITTIENITSTTEFMPSSTIQAAVQTGRSVSGARFLPFPAVDKLDQLDSTESIIDKLDRVQSELSSGFLANGRFVPRRYSKKPFSATSLTLPTTSTIAPTSSPIAPITITNITKRPRVQTTLDDVAAFLPKDFSRSYYRTSTTTGPLTKRPRISTTLDEVDTFLSKNFSKSSYRMSTPSSSTTKRSKLQTTLDDLDGFLPKDYPKGNYRSPFKRPSLITSTTFISTPSSTEKSVASTGRKALTTIEDISAFLPPGYKFKKEDMSKEKSSTLDEHLIKNKHGESIEALASTTEQTKSIQDLFIKSAVDISDLLPPGYKPEVSNSTASTVKIVDSIQELIVKPSVNISALLPSGYKSDVFNSYESINGTNPVKNLLNKSNVDILALLPSGFGPNSGLTRQSVPLDVKNVTAGSNSFKVVFPSRPGGRKSIHKITTSVSVANRGSTNGNDAATPRIQKGWPTRVTTEFTGWPTSSTTPISIEKLLEAARTATISSANVSLQPIISEISSTSSTTTTTTTTLRPTTPGICDEDCEVAGTIKIIDNATWLPELLDRNTREWQDLAEEIEREMNLVFAKSPVLRKWFRSIRIDSFSQGSVLVDYFVELADLKEKINTQQLKVIFHDSLRTFNFDNPMEARPKGPMKLGKFTIDPKSTDFVVIPRVAAPKMVTDENRLIPQWAIAVIVIGVGGLLFIIVFGVSVLMNRQHGSKLKPSITAMYEEEVTKNVMTHATPSTRPVSEYQKNESQTMWNDPGWHDKPFESTSHKILVDGLPYERKYNMYDSWKSEWNGYYYPPSQTSGSKFSRHHPDYDINF